MTSPLSRGNFVAAATVGLLISGFASRSWAEDSADEAKAKAKAQLAKGARYLEAGSYARALADFEEAYRIFPSPKIFYNLALANAGLGRNADALREFEQFYNGHRPHQGIANARPLCPLPTPIVNPDKIGRLNIRRRDRLGGILHEYQHAA